MMSPIRRACPVVMYLAILGLLGSTSSPAKAAACFHVSPKTPGWKYLEAPSGYLFSSEVEQFRANQKAVLWESWPNGQKIVYTEEKGGTRHQANLYFYNQEFSAARIGFSWSVDNQEIEVIAYSTNYPFRFVVRGEAKFSGSFLDLDWPSQRIERLEIIFHNHLRKPPVIDQVWLGKTTTMPVDTVPLELQKESLLFFKSLDGSDLELCNELGRSYQVFGVAPIAEPARVALGEVFQKTEHQQKRLLGILVAVGLIALTAVVTGLALRARSKNGAAPPGSSS
jgi:hypothetical protein